MSYYLLILMFCYYVGSCSGYELETAESPLNIGNYSLYSLMVPNIAYYKNNNHYRQRST